MPQNIVLKAIFVILLLVWLRIRVIRPHWFGNIIVACVCFALSPQFASLLQGDSDSLLEVCFPILILTVILHLLAKRHDKKRSAKQAGKQASPSDAPPTATEKAAAPTAAATQQKESAPKAAATQQKESAPKAAATQQKASAPKAAATQQKESAQQDRKTAAAKQEHVQQKEAATQEKREQPVRQEAVAPVKQTLNTCVRCSQPLCGPKCSHCGFDHTAEPVDLLCLIPPKKLQIQIPDN